MATTLKQTEAAPVAYPAQPDGLSAGAAAIDLAMIWQRIEAYTAWRFTARNVVWLVEGPGEWEPPLAPATISGVEIWADNAWAAAAPAASAMGYELACAGPYRFTGSVSVAARCQRRSTRLTGAWPNISPALTTRLPGLPTIRPDLAAARSPNRSAGHRLG